MRPTSSFAQNSQSTRSGDKINWCGDCCHTARSTLCAKVCEEFATVTASILFFIVIGAVCLASAIGVISSRHPIHSALYLLVNFVSLAVLYVTLEAQFLAAAQ